MAETQDHNKSKEQIVAEMKYKAEEKRQRAFVKETLYPWLLANSKSIDDAKNMLYAAATVMEQTFHVAVSKEQKRLSTVKVSELDPMASIKPDPQFNRDRELLAMFENEPVGTAEGLLKGARMAIESFEREQSTKTELKDLPAELLD